MSDIDQQFIEYVVKSLVGNPDAVQVDRRVDDKGVLLELTVDPNDLGRVIGKKGVTAQSLRTLLRALGTKNEARYNLKIIDNGTGEHAHREDASTEKHESTESTQAPVENLSVSEQALEDAFVPKVETKVEAEAIVETKAEAEVEVAKPSLVQETSDRMAQTRRELAEFDDLDL
jgi:predicted RNA-binding protein YlqC (UPF0109 family)